MQIATIGIDLAKAVFQVHGVDAHGKTVMKKQRKRTQVAADAEAICEAVTRPTMQFCSSQAC